MIKKKTLELAESRAKYDAPKNRTHVSTSDSPRPIPAKESDGIPERIREVVGDVPVATFARRCFMSEASLRAYISGSKSPGMKQLIKLSAPGGHSIDWLLRGRLPKTYGEMLAGEPQAQAAPVMNPLLLQQVIDFFHRWLHENANIVRIDQSRHGAVIAVLYNIAAKTGRIDKLELEQVLQLAA